MPWRRRQFGCGLEGLTMSKRSAPEDSDQLTPSEIALLRRNVKQGYQEIDAILDKRDRAKRNPTADPISPPAVR
jgi:hypothetical protein